MKRFSFLVACLLMAGMMHGQVADRQTYLNEFKKKCR